MATKNRDKFLKDRRRKRVDAEFLPEKQPDAAEIEARRTYDAARLSLSILIRGFASEIQGDIHDHDEIRLLLELGSHKILDAIAVKERALLAIQPYWEARRNSNPTRLRTPRRSAKKK